MADDDSGQRSSSFLNSLAHPQSLNLLGAINAGNQAASNMLSLREKQAQQQIGEILQQATGPDGVVDHQRAQALAAQAGPGVQMGMQTFLTNNATLRGNQIKQASELHSLTGNMAASVMNDPSDANLAKIKAAGVTAGLPPSALAEIDRIAALPIEQRGPESYKHVVGNIDALGQLARGGYATPKLETFGNVAAPVATTPPTPWTQGGVNVGPPAATIGLSPDAAATVVKYNENGVEKTTTLGELHNKLGIGVPTGGAVGGQGGAPRGGAPSITPPPPPPGTTARPAAPGGAPPAAASTPAVPAPAPRPAREISGAQPGQVKAAEVTAEDSAKAGTALTARGDQVPTNKANYANMLVDLEKIPTMGPGTEREAYVNSLLQKWTGTSLGTMTAEQIAAADNFAKLANIAVGQQLAAIGGTDARQALFMGSNPRLDLSKLSNRQITNMLNGNEDAIQAKSRAWQEWLRSGNGPDTYGRFQDDFNHHFDPRVFQQQYMSPDEIEGLKKSMVGRDGKLTGEGTKFFDDVKYARSRGWIP